MELFEIGAKFVIIDGFVERERERKTLVEFVDDSFGNLTRDKIILLFNF